MFVRFVTGVRVEGLDEWCFLDKYYTMIFQGLIHTAWGDTARMVFQTTLQGTAKSSLWLFDAGLRNAEVSCIYFNVFIYKMMVVHIKSGGSSGNFKGT